MNTQIVIEGDLDGADGLYEGLMAIAVAVKKGKMHGTLEDGQEWVIEQDRN